MPLKIEGQQMQMPLSVADFIQTYPQYTINARRLSSVQPINVDPRDPYLFVHQMESACVSPDDQNIHMIGADETTTCCCVIIRHTGSLATGLGHFDGSDTKDGLQRIIDGVVEITKDWSRRQNINYNDLLSSNYQYECHLIGGFEDARNISIDVIMQLLECLYESNIELHLKTACIYSNNTHYQDNIPYPYVTGVICHVKTGNILPASFTFLGPLEEIRRLRFSTKPPIVMPSVYNPFTKILEISPYEWTLTNDTIEQLLGSNTNSFLHYLSTSPLAEKATFVSSCKTALKFLKDNRESLFRSGKSYRFIRTNNQWKLVD